LVILLLLFLSAVPGAHAGKSDRKRNNQQVERTIAANPRVVLSACVLSGDLTVHGWDRNEVRARISDGVQIELIRVDQTKSALPTELKLSTKERRSRTGPGCLPLGDIELNVPRGASLKLQTNNGEIEVSDVARLTATSQAGSVTLVKVQTETNVTTIGGEISVRDSTGSFKLHTVGGSVVARDLNPAAADDAFEADIVGGEVTVDRVRHQRLRVNTVSGEVDYTGPLARGGRYSFQSISGRLRLTLPANSSFRLSGTVGNNGDLRSDFNLTEKDHSSQRGSMRQLDAVVGSGDASINLSFFTGSIQIRKQ
jgi:DUF4097 and DUF4098 domain-containing protein YvlB